VCAKRTALGTQPSIVRGRSVETDVIHSAMAEYTTILVDDGAPIARITLNRPDKRNPIGPATCGELVHALAHLKTSAPVRVIVLTGAGPVFCRGGDLSAMPLAPGP